jgi:hypothetical protein
MGGYSLHLGVQENDTCVEFIQRVAFKALAGEETGGTEVLPGQPPPRSIIIVHCSAASDCNCPVSTLTKQVPQTRNIVATHRPCLQPPPQPFRQT